MARELLYNGAPHDAVDSLIVHLMMEAGLFGPFTEILQCWIRRLTRGVALTDRAVTGNQ